MLSWLLGNAATVLGVVGAAMLGGMFLYFRGRETRLEEDRAREIETMKEVIELQKKVADAQANPFTTADTANNWLRKRKDRK